MAILKYFFAYDNSDFIPRTIKGSWDCEHSNSPKKLVTDKNLYGPSVRISRTAPPYISKSLLMRFVSDGLLSDISFDQIPPYTNNVTITIGANSDDPSNIYRLHLYYYLYITQGDSDLIRGVIFSNKQHLFPLTIVKKGFSYTNNFIGFNALAGDRVVLEIGVNNLTISGLNYYYTIYTGATETTTPDLVEGSTAVTTNPGTIVFT
jgi:hypothetical protein